MPLLHLDFAALATSRPDLLAPAHLQHGVTQRLALLAAGTCQVDEALHASALAGLQAMRGPFYVSVSALRTTLQACASTADLPLERWPFHVAAIAAAEARHARHVIGKWPRRDRWWLGVTGRDLQEAATALQSSIEGNPEFGD